MRALVDARGITKILNSSFKRGGAPMCEVAPDIHKCKIGKRWHYVLKYSDLESCFVHAPEKKVHLQVWFSMSRWNRAEYYHRIAAFASQQLVTIEFNPQRTLYWRRWEPWSSERRPLVVTSSVFAIGNDFAVETGLTRQILSRLVAKEFAEIAQYGLFATQWYFQVSLCASACEVKCLWQVRKGVKIVRIKKLSTLLKPFGRAPA